MIADLNIDNALPLVSVHMITYNQEKYIREAIDGVLMQQTDFNIELIIANDCSTDGTDSIIREYIISHPKGRCIKYYKHEKNAGIMPNFIFALRECKAKYIAFCEGDDYWTDPFKLQKQIAVIESGTQYSMVITNRRIEQTDGSNYEECYEKEYGKNVFTINDIINGFVAGTQTILFRNHTSLPDYLAAHPEFYYGDRYVSYFCSLFGDIVLIPDITAVYRMTGGGVWSVNTPLAKLHTFTKFMEDFHASLGIPVNNATLASFAFDASYTTLRYCVKRPGLFSNKMYRQMIIKPWVTYTKINRVKMFCSVLFNRKK